MDLSQQTLLTNYTYNWFDSQEQALALGLGSMFNHSRNHNVGFIKDKYNTVIRYYTLQDIEADQELFINYGPHLWFDGDEEEGTRSISGNYSDSSSDDGDPFSRLCL